MTILPSPSALRIVGTISERPISLLRVTPEGNPCDAHLVRDLFGSQSNTVTSAFMRANSDASNTAHVDFPTPPLGLAMTMTGIARSCQFCVTGIISITGKNSNTEIYSITGFVSHTGFLSHGLPRFSNHFRQNPTKARSALRGGSTHQLRHSCSRRRTSHPGAAWRASS